MSPVARSLSAAVSLAESIGQDVRRAAGALLTPGESVLVGISGGADSTALACLLAEGCRRGLPLELVLGHVDHRWRGATAAAADWAGVEALGTRLGVRTLCSAPPAPSTPRTEAAARHHRYQALARMARAVGARKLALAHHRGDQAETILMRMLRGSGPRGLTGIPPRRPLGAEGLEVVRPLLDIDPGALRAWLRERGIAWREDPGNEDLAHDRNRIRNRLARAAQRGAEVTLPLARHAGRARDQLARREREVVGSMRSAWRLYPWAGAVRAPREWLAALIRDADVDVALHALGHAIHADRHGPWLTRRHVALVRTLLPRGGAHDLPRRLRFVVAGRGAWLAWRDMPTCALPRPVVEWGVADDRSSCPGAESAMLDASVLGRAPRLRRLVRADRFVPFGTQSGRRRSVSGWLSKRGVPGFARRGVLVLEGQHGVAWVVGEGIDRGHALTSTSQRAAHVTLAP